MSVSSFGFDRPESSPGFLLWQMSVAWQRRIKEALAKHKVSHPQFVMMALLLWCDEQNRSPNQAFLIEQTKLDKMTVSNTLKRLVSEALVERDICDQDTRAKRIRLTKKGVLLIKKLVPIVEAIDADYFKCLDADENASLIQMLQKLTQTADATAKD